MKLSNVHVTKEQKEFLDRIIFEDAASSIGGENGELGNAVQWCIDACIAIEKMYGIDACFVGFNDIRNVDSLKVAGALLVSEIDKAIALNTNQ
jgi:hypothetical protein